MKSLVNYLSEEQAVQCVGKGWESLVRKVYNAKIGLGVPVGIIQVKEKWGGLRIYTDYYVREIEEVITEVGRQSLEVCEQCGAPAGLVAKGTWYQTRCEEHRGDWEPIKH
jgi:hypothetical protein